MDGHHHYVARAISADHFSFATHPDTEVTVGRFDRDKFQTYGIYASRGLITRQSQPRSNSSVLGHHAQQLQVHHPMVIDIALKLAV